MVALRFNCSIFSLYFSLLVEFSVEGASHIPACFPMIVLCISTLAIHKSVSTETNSDYSSLNQADLKYL